MSLWITEAEVVRLMDMKGAIAALDRALALEAAGKAENMVKTHVIWGGHHTLHAIGATFAEEGFVGTKTWAHANGAAPLLILFDSHNGSLKAIIEAFALGQLRTGGISGLATKYLAADGASDMALIGTGKQAMTQLAAVAAVRPLRRVRAFSRDGAAGVRRAGQEGLGLNAEEASSVAHAVDGAGIVTLVTRATKPVLGSGMVAAGTHVNAVGAISPERTEFEPALLSRCAAVVADSVPQVQNLSSEFMQYYGRDESKWRAVRPLSAVVAEGKGRPAGADLTLFKAMGMGISDLALGIEILRRAGRAAPRPRISAPATRQTVRLKEAPHERDRPFHRSIRCQARRNGSLARDRHPQGDDRRRDRAPGESPASGQRPPALDHRASARRARATALPPASRLRSMSCCRASGPCPYRQNSTQVNFVIRGRGHSIVGGKRFEVNLYDVWNTPSMHIYWHGNDSKDIQVRLTYSNAALLELMNIHYVEENPPPIEPVKHEEQSEEDKRRRISPYGTIKLDDEGAYLMPYEVLINPPTVESKALHWPWEQVKHHLDKLQALGKDYVGRRLYMLYNPMTGRTNGCTPSFFATMTVRPPKIVDRPHRHTSAAINYYFHGTGRSTVGGEVFEWKAGDLMLSAPGWAVHNHASYDDFVYELTVQDQPLNIAMESLLWQESLKLPLAVLGVQEGFGTNRAAG